MDASSMVECSFFIPVNRDANLSDGLPHDPQTWEQLDSELFVHFEGRTVAPERYRGFYKDPDTGKRVDDESIRFIVALPEDRVNVLKDLLRQACGWFQQKCIYLIVAGRVEFIGPEANETS